MKIYKIINKYFLELIFFLIFLIFVCYFYKSFSNDFSTSNYSYNELFINYHSGFIRRGLVGEIFFKLNSILDISHKVFFCLLFITLYTLEIILAALAPKKTSS
jgi:hypothetical protein